ncbi:metallophosphoesterase family protein [Methanolobus profundi]|uniref:Calcineurin-like phosphoesterase domain-containing protein n=1 Tax=Methanolobus profundi TaxID=487685 RepID=A0A1I4PX59_9EURY|nr:metallophosphoesterase [Methanolobus profundi]SFM32401.1 hypothetical protein SAMN04488696_0963 [Methanolobus profundi]
MRLFAIADPHGNYSKIEELLKIAGKVDVVLIAGDITNFGPDEKALELFSLFEQPILAVPGNCDQRSIIDLIHNSPATDLHRKSVTIEGVRFIGMGGSNPTPFCTPFEIQECDYEESLGKMTGEKHDHKEPLVILTHAPPFGILDQVGDEHVGCKVLTDLLDIADLMVCGHIHEARGIVLSGKTTIVNPGMAALGFAAVIDIGSDTEDPNIEVTLIEAGREDI